MRTVHQLPTVVLSLALAWSPAPARAADARGYELAIAEARAGRYERALPILKQLTQAHPRRAAYRHDLIAVLSWSEQHEQALRESDSLKLDATVPDYVLLAIGKSAVSMSQPKRATQAYRMVVVRRPRDADAALGLALALLQAKDEPAADAQLRRVLLLTRQQPALRQTAAKALLARGESQRAQAFFSGPGSPVVAVAVPAETLPVVNAPRADAKRDPEPDERRELAQAQVRNGLAIRAAAVAVDQDFSARRYALGDAALADNAVLIETARRSGAADILVRLQRDRVVALKDRGLMQQAVDLHAALRTGSTPVPGYVAQAAADALLSLRRPQDAAEIYREALQRDPQSAGLRTGLVYALLESEDFVGANAVLAPSLADPERQATARRLQVALLRFGDRLPEAQRAIQTLRIESPTDAGLLLEEADLLANRGAPRAAAVLYRAVLAGEPGQIKAKIGLADSLRAQGAIAQAAALIAELQRDAPEHPAVKRLLRSWLRGQSPVLTTGVTVGRGQGQVTGNDELVWESALYSGLSENGLRWFTNHQSSRASFNGQSARHERVGVGLEWSQSDLQTTFELGRDLQNAQDTVWAAGAGWQLNDQLSFRARYENQTNDLPIKARPADAEKYLGAPTYVHADRLVLGAAYRWNESRRLAVDFSNYNFNDGNHRSAWALAWTERLHSAYGHTVDLQASAYTSANTLRDAIYFSPQRDAALSTTLTGDWLTWRQYERSFNQRAALTLGSYRQLSDVTQGAATVGKAYGWSAFAEARYEHEWHLDADSTARYGLGARRFPYDGNSETKVYFYANLNWRF